jgi:hypothetical protein
MTVARSFSTALLAAAAGISLACSGAQPSRPAVTEESTAPNLDELRAHVLDLVGVPRCDGTPECRAMAFGAKPCGGPRSYLVYSTAVSDSVTLAEAVRQFTERDAANNEALGLMSDCMFVTEPQVACTSGICTIVR